MNSATRVYPDWKNAANKAIERFSYGELIPYTWLYEILDMVPHEEKMTIKEWKDSQLKFLSASDNFKSYLLEEYQMYLQTVYGKGYLIVMPGDQTDLSFTKMTKSIKKSLRKGYKALVHVNHKMLTQSQSRDNANKLSTLASLESMIQRRVTFDNGENEGE